jgi:hypothetical protein
MEGTVQEALRQETSPSEDNGGSTADSETEQRAVDDFILRNIEVVINTESLNDLDRAELLELYVDLNTASLRKSVRKMI